MTYKDLASGFFQTQQVHQLANPVGAGYTPGGILKSVSSISKELKRVPPVKLEEVYFKDPITFNTINKGVQMLSAAGDRIVYNSPKEEKTFTKFLDELSTVGGDYTWGELKNFIWHSEMLFGPAWIEMIWNQSDTEIVDLGRLDPKIMDYARDSMNNIVLDDNDKPIGYTQKLPFGTRIEGKGDPIPEKWKRSISLDGNKIFLLPKRIAMIPPVTLSDGYSSVGLVEPAYDSIIRKLMIEEAGVNSAYQRWMSPLVAYIGDDKHPPTNNLANQTLTQMKNMKHDMYSTYPYYVKLEALEMSKSTEALSELLKYLRENQSASTGMPMPLATGAGEATNRSTLNNMQNLMEFTLNDIAKRTASNIVKYIFKPVAESKGLKTVPQLIPNRVNIDEIDDFAQRMTKYVKEGVLTTQDIKNKVLEMEGITSNEKDKNPKPKKEKKEVNDEDDDFERNESLSEISEGIWKSKTI